MNWKPFRHNLWAVAGFAILCGSSFAQEMSVSLPGGKTATIVSDTEFRRSWRRPGRLRRQRPPLPRRGAW
jgi:hypothetical protein